MKDLLVQIALDEVASHQTISGFSGLPENSTKKNSEVEVKVQQEAPGEFV